jgi:hypothetical protein
MSSEKLLEAIGDIDDRYIVEATPENSIKKPTHNWMKYAALAACFCICITVIFTLGSSIKIGSQKSESAAPMEDAVAEDGCIIETEEFIEEEAALEEAPAAEEMPAPEEAPEGPIFDTEEAPAEDAAIEESVNDIAYGIIFNGTTYFQISFQQRKDYEILDENASGLTPENTYKITASDLGDYLGTVEDCAGDPDMIGCDIYAFAKFPDDKNICIIDVHGTYQFYVAQ